MYDSSVWNEIKRTHWLGCNTHVTLFPILSFYFWAMIKWYSLFYLFFCYVGYVFES